MKTYTVDLIKDYETDDMFLPLTNEILKDCGWEVGDEIEWIDNKDGSWTMQKVQKQVEQRYFLVECISTHRMRYVVKAKNHFDAESAVVRGTALEFSQKHLGETVTSSHEITHEHILKLCDEDNNYCKTWSDEKKFEAFVTENIYGKKKG